MLAINNNYISHLNLVTADENTYKQNWLDIKSINTSDEVAQEYKNICSKFHSTSKWVLIVNPENNSLDELSISANISHTKVLQVHSNKVNVSVKNIEAALKKGNCSAVVLNNVILSESELLTLSTSAQKGGTKCIILNSKTFLH